MSEVFNNNKCEFSIGDYKESLKNTKEGDFIYMDPPYFQTKLKGHSGIFKKWKYEHDIECSEEFKRLDKLGCKVLMSNSDTPEVRDIFKEYKIVEINVHRDKSHTKVGELLIMNY